ncbi:hypothetical protein [Methylopila sp. 73B]|uniref:hypothetical protein n=1 Tax=Methylopila sp. 73B TaxID=1120792 RepID=UPI0012DC8E52|nr:hypothetical protein [Methylopila sp. 73B]
MNEAFRKALRTLLLSTGVLAVAAPAGSVERPKSIIGEPYDQNPRTITRPATKADRDWRRGRAAPRVEMQAQPARRPRYEPPRYDGYGRRLNVPGRPETYDAIGRARRYRPQAAPSVSTPRVQTDIGTRINQFPPR